MTIEKTSVRGRRTSRRGEPVSPGAPLGAWRGTISRLANGPRVRGRWPVRLASILAGATLAACGGGGSGGGTTPRPVPTNEIGRYVDQLPAWDEYSPPVAAGDTRSGEPTSEDVLVEQVEGSAAGDVAEGRDVIYACTTTPRTVAQNPEEIVSFEPDRDVLYPGALIQGRSHRNGNGGLLPLNIDERANISVSIPALATGENFRTVPPRQDRVESAIGEMIGNATRDDLSTSSSVSFTLEEFTSERQFALAAGLSGRYLGFSGSASGSIDRSATESTVSLHYIERMYNVVYSAPNLPEQFFSEGFTPSVLERYTERGEIGPDNLPVYVSSVAYGRMLMFTVTSTASAEEIRATLRAAYSSGVNNVEAQLDTRQQEILRNSKISIASFGGDAENVLGVIRSGNWREYFAEPAPLSSAQPLSYTLRNLGDSSVASVGETTEYNLRTCEARGSAGDTFSFRSVQRETLRVPTPADSHVGDFTGDGQDDLLWTHLSSGGGNRHAVAVSNGDGTFDFRDAATHPAQPPEGWGTYAAHVGDFDADEIDDIAFVYNDARNVVYLAYSNGDGTFRYSDRFEHSVTDPVGGWASYEVLVGNFDGANGDDLLFNAVGDGNRIHLRVSLREDGMPGLSGDSRRQQAGTGIGWTGYEAYVGNANGDGFDDLIWLKLNDERNDMRVALFRGGTTDNLHGPVIRSDRGSIGWGDYKKVLADIDGKNGTDVAFVAVSEGRGDRLPIHRNVALSGDGYSFPDAQFLDRPAGIGTRAEAAAIDVNADGRDDLLLSDDTTDLLHLYVALGTDSGEFLFTRPVQTAPDQDDWATFRPLVLDVDADGDEDLVYTSDSGTLRLYVAIARGGNS